MSRTERSEWSGRRSWSSCRSTLAGVWTLAAIGLVACKQAPQAPETGALLLQLGVAPGVVVPDELRLSVYDDSGVLWNGVRFPSEGALKPESGQRLGTILIQPGPSQGRIRMHVRGFTEGTRVLDGTLVVAPEARSLGTFSLTLDTAVPPDLDDDSVPDDIDDCLAAPNPNQGGCPSGVPEGSDAGTPPDASPATDVIGRADAVDPADVARDVPADTTKDVPPDVATDVVAIDGRDAATDAVAIDRPDDNGDSATQPDVQSDACAESACRKSLGAVCASETECLSTFCVDGVCCANACVGPCRSCNQPNLDGLCQAHPPGSNPEGECLAGATCNGAGACGPSPSGAKPNGQLCAGANECLSGFCTDGVCCGTACTAACQTCATGTCQSVTRKEDVPECVAPRTCNPAGKCG